MSNTKTFRNWRQQISKTNIHAKFTISIPVARCDNADLFSRISVSRMSNCSTPSWEKLVEDGAIVNVVCWQAVAQGQSDLFLEFPGNIEAKFPFSVMNYVWSKFGIIIFEIFSKVRSLCNTFQDWADHRRLRHDVKSQVRHPRAIMYCALWTSKKIAKCIEIKLKNDFIYKTLFFLHYFTFAYPYLNHFIHIWGKHTLRNWKIYQYYKTKWFVL